MWLIASFVALFVHFPAFSVSGSSQFALCLSAIGAVLLGMAWPPERAISLKGLSVGLALFLAFGLAANLPNLASGNWTNAWGPLAWFGKSSCIALLLALSVQAIWASGAINVSLLRKLVVFGIALGIVSYFIPLLPLFERMLPYTYADNPFGIFYTTRIAAFWCVIGLCLSTSFAQKALFLCGLYLCKSVVGWSVAIFLFLMRSDIKQTGIWIWLSLGFALLTQSYFKLSGALAGLRLENWTGWLSVISKHPLGLGSNPILYNMAAGHRGLLPDPTSDILFVIVRYGWIAVPLLLIAAWQLYSNRSDSALWQVLACSALFAAVQTSLHHSHNLMLAWIVLCAWLIERSNRDAEGKESI